MNSIAKKLKTLRGLHNYTQDYVAEYLGISQNTYSLMERGETRITIDRLESFGLLYNMHVSDIMNFNETFIIPKVHDDNGQIGGTKEVTIHNVSDEERRLFQDSLTRLEKENERLVKIIEQLSGIKM